MLLYQTTILNSLTTEYIRKDENENDIILQPDKLL